MRRAFAAVAALGLAAALPPARGESPAVVSGEFVFDEAPFPSCHASTIAETSDGTLVAAWFGGTHEKHRDVGIWVSRREGDRWTRPVEVATGIQYRTPDGEEHRYPCWNPVLFQPKDSSLLLFYKCGPSPDAWWGMLTRSGDGGKSWSFPRRLPEGILGPVKNKPIRLPDGRLLCGSSTEHDGWRVHFEITPDLGRTWTRVGPINDGQEIGAIQPSLLRHADGRLQALGRSQQGRVWTAWSDDGGLTWGPMTLTDLPNPNAGTDAVTLADGRHLLVYNHTEKGRTPLNVAVSQDGEAWRMAVVLEDQPGEYSYPAVIQTSDGLVHVTYTWKRERIRHVVLDPKKIE
ncbi:MAG TPA: sialidase family protein [Planctomycetaceae bacterium]